MITRAGGIGVSINKAIGNMGVGNKEASSQLELTPLIDMIFIVIVFLLLTANTRLLSLPVSVPETDDAETTSSIDNEVINITIELGNNGWSIDKRYYPDWGKFKYSLLADIKEKPDSVIAIASDREADVQRFVKVLTLLQKNQIQNTQIILEEE